MSSVENNQTEPTFESSTIKHKYRGRYRGQKRPSDYSRRRMENIPITSFSREAAGRRRNSRRRQPNKPFYNQESQKEILSTTSTLSSLSSSDDNSEISTIGVTQNIKKPNNNDVSEKSSFESLSSTHLFNPTLNGFYITKNHQEKKYPEQYTHSLSTTDKEFNVVTHTTEQYSTPETADDVSETFTTALTEPIQTFSEVQETTTSSSMSTNFDSMLEMSTQTTYSVETNTPTDSSSNSTTNFTEYYEDTSIDSTEKLMAQVEDESSKIPVIYTDMNSIATAYPTKPTLSFSTLKITEIESSTNSIAVPQTKTYFTRNNEPNLVNAEDVGENINNASTEETSVSTNNSFDSEELTTEYRNEKNESMDEENITYTTQINDVEQTWTTVPNPEEQTTEAYHSTKIDIITQVNSAEDTTTISTENSESKEIITSQNAFGNDIENEQNKMKPPINRDGRKFKDRRFQHKSSKPKVASSRFSSRHRFSSTNVTPRTPVSVRPSDFYKHRFSSTPDVTQRTTSTSVKVEESVQMEYNQNISDKVEEALTEIALSKNVKPTIESTKKKNISTTPMLYKVELRKERVNKHFVFNCFGKPLNQFYSDPRDCRLFHYCTNGYSKNQLLDMKFVCDLGTHFDDEKLVCTRDTPKRCL